MAERILITGATGRLGSALTRTLGENAVIHQLSLDATAGESPQGPVFQGSVTDAAAVTQAMSGVDAVIHCASYPGAIEPYAELMDTNVMGTYTVLEAAGKQASVQRFIHVSSLQWYGLHEGRDRPRMPMQLPLNEDHPSLAVGYYDTSKVLAERLVQSFAGRFRKSAISLRPAWMITPDLEATFKALPPVNGPHLNDYVGMSDVVAAVRLALDHEPSGGYDVFNLHADDQRSTMSTAELVASRYPEVTTDDSALSANGEFTALVDCTRAKARLGWSPVFRCAR